jgi:hypothetical protein
VLGISPRVDQVYTEVAETIAETVEHRRPGPVARRHAAEPNALWQPRVEELPRWQRDANFSVRQLGEARAKRASAHSSL